MQIHNTSFENLPSIARCHIYVFPDSLSARFGEGYCIKMLSFYIEDSRGLLFHLENDGKVIGYCGGLRRNEPGKPGSATSMIQYTFKALVTGLIKKPWLIFHHEILANIPLIIKNLKLRFSRRYGLRKKTSENISQNFVSSFGLVVIGVSPEYQGKGYGSELLKEFEKRARDEGFPCIHLSVRKDNIQAISAYRKNGWMVAHEGKNELSMYKDLTKA